MVTLVCPRCRSALDARPAALHCLECGRVFPADHGIADFSEGNYYDSFTPGETLPDWHREGLQLEIEGTVRRVRDFYLPMLRENAVTTVLDCGTGNGHAVDLLGDEGLDAWGVDLSSLRRFQWRERRRRDHLAVADALRLPFADASFDAVISSGVLEHIGVEEWSVPSYRVAPRVDQRESRITFLRELLRVVRPGGTLFLDFPNGAFPVDFWHGTDAGRGRLHSTSERFLPKVAEVRAMVRTIDPAIELVALSPWRRLQFHQVGGHWYGRLLAPAVDRFFRLMRIRPFTLLASSALNPFLVLRLRRSGP